jgi:hypothetical protein
VNNAVARAAGLLAVAVVPVAVGITGDAYTDPAALDAGFRTAMLLCAGLLVAGALVAAVLVRRPLGVEQPGQANRIPLEECLHCGVTGPQLYPEEPSTTAGETPR